MVISIQTITSHCTIIKFMTHHIYLYFSYIIYKNHIKEILFEEQKAEIPRTQESLSIIKDIRKIEKMCVIIAVWGYRLYLLPLCSFKCSILFHVIFCLFGMDLQCYVVVNLCTKTPTPAQKWPKSLYIHL